MSVIIRLQNLPWSANALDIRQYFKGLSIPEGGVHIVGGEMGDAFIAFSTDEDARQAMMKDRGKLNEVQIRLLLSSRTEMQKVIETARQQSLLALQKAGALTLTPAVVAQTSGALPVPQPPVITTNSLQNILGTQLGAAPSFQTYQQQAGITLIPPSKSKQSDPDSKASNRHEGNESVTRDRRRSTSRDRRRSRSRDRNDRSGGKRRRDRSRSRSRERERDRDRERERERDRKGNRQRSSRRSRSRERSRDRSRERGRNSNRSNRNSKDTEMSSNNRLGRESTVKSGTKNADPRDPQSGKAIISPWSVTPMNAYETNSAQNVSLNVATQLQKPNSLNPFSTNSAMGVGPNISNAYTTSSSVAAATMAAATMAAKTDPDTKNSAITTMIPPFHSYSTTTSNTNNYSINILSNPLVASTSTNSDAAKPTFALFNPYTAALRVSTSNSNSQDSNSSSTFNANAHENQTTFPGLVLDKNVLITPQQVAQLGADSKAPSNMAQVQQQQAQQPITFANTNPYAQIYPSLFAQAAAAGTGIANPTRTNSQNQPSSSQDTKLNQRAKGNQKSDSENSEPRSCSIKISNMCTGTTYSDLRKFFSGLFIPHNGIKMINDRSGARTGVAYIQFSRSSCVSKAMVRNNTFLKTKRVSLEVVPDEEFKSTEDSYKPSRDRESYNRYDRHEPSTAGDSGGRGGDNRFEYGRNSPPHSKPDMGFGEDGNTTNPFSGNESSRGRLTVLHIEAIPAMATEHDIMKMFSAYTIFDILLTESPGNRKEFTAYVQFSREDEARAALAENSRHLIGNRIVRIRPAREEDMQKAKEKLRLASEQLKKEETRDDLGKRNNIGCDDTNGDQDTGENNDPNGTLSSGNTANIVNDFTGQGDIKCPQDGPSDPRLRRLQNNCTLGSNVDAEVDTERKDILSRQNAGPQQHNVPDFSQNSNPPPFKPVPMGSIENNFVILKNCDYGTHINDVAQLMLSAKLDLKHIEPLYNDRQMPTGEFIVEFTNCDDAATAAKRFNNTQFRNRNLRVRSIQPQEIADRMRKPFMNYFPGGRFPPHPMAMRGNFDLSGRGGGGAGFMPHFRMNGGYMGDAGDRSMGPMPGNHINVRGRGGDGGGSRMLGSVSRRRGGMRRHFAYPDQDVNMEGNFDEQGVDNDENAAARSDAEEDVVSVSSNSAGKDSVSGIPEKFNRPGCVIALENVPFKAELKDIVQFFGEFGVTEDDIIRRFNDDGTATGDARVAFATPAKARAAYESKRHKSIFKRTIYLSIV